jgi:hypothetical protein
VYLLTTKQNKLPSFIDRWDTYALVLLADGRFYKWLNIFDMSHESAQCALDNKVLEIKQMGRVVVWTSYFSETMSELVSQAE